MTGHDRLRWWYGSAINWPVRWKRARDAARGLYRAEPAGAATWRAYRTTEPLTLPLPPLLWYA